MAGINHGVFPLVRAAVQLRVPFLDLDILSTPGSAINQGHDFRINIVRLPSEIPDANVQGIFNWQANRPYQKDDLVAVKQIVVSFTRDSSEEQSTSIGTNKAILNEMQVMNHPNLRTHQNICSILGFGLSYSPITVLSDALEVGLGVEYADCGSLPDFWEMSFIESSYDDKLGLCADIADGVAALHTEGIIHGDLKAENILIFSRMELEHSSSISGDLTLLLTAKIADFGFSVMPGDYAGNCNGVNLPGFTPPWAPPEAIAGQEIQPQDLRSLDIYTYGFLFYRIITGGSHPFEISHGSESVSSRLSLAEIQELKREDRIFPVLRTRLKVVGQSLKSQLSEEDIEKAIIILSRTIRANPTERFSSTFELLEQFEEQYPSLKDRKGQVKKPDPPSIPRRGTLINHVTELRLYPLSPSQRKAIFDELLELTQCLRDSSPPSGVNRVECVLAACQLMACYIDGYGTAQDTVKATEALSLAARNGSLAAQLAIIPYMQNQGLREIAGISQPQMKVWLEQGLVQGQLIACAHLAFIDEEALKNLLDKMRKDICHTRWNADFGPQFEKELLGPNVRDSFFTRSFQLIASKLQSQSVAFDAILPSGWRWLDHVAAYGDTQLLQQVPPSCPVDITAVNSSGQSPLEIACLNGQVDMAFTLLDLQGRTGKGIGSSHPLHFLASMTTDYLTCENFVSNAVAISGTGILNQKDSAEKSPLHAAIQPNTAYMPLADFVALKVLLNAGADIFVADADGHSALSLAAKLTRVEMVQTMLDSSSTPVTNHQRAKALNAMLLPAMSVRLCSTIQENYQEALCKILSSLATPESLSEYQQLFHEHYFVHVAMFEAWDILEVILADCQLMSTAVSQNCLNAALGSAVSSANAPHVEQLLNAGANIVEARYKNDSTIFHAAAGWAQPSEVLPVLIDHLKSIQKDCQLLDVRNKRNQTAFDAAVIKSHFPAARLLLEARMIDYNEFALSREEETGVVGFKNSLLGEVAKPGWRARRQMDFLLGLDPPADADKVSTMGESLLHKIARQDRLSKWSTTERKSVFEYVRRKFPHLRHSKDVNGFSPLHYAVGGLCLTTVQLLTIRGQDHSPVGKDGRTPLDWALGMGSGQSASAQELQRLPFKALMECSRRLVGIIEYLKGIRAKAPFSEENAVVNM